jgi:vacuolar-type H+-ATPase subunit H
VVFGLGVFEGCLEVVDGICRHVFVDGDEAEVLDFLGGLIEQNRKLASQLEHLESLMRLAERTVIEAGKEADNIKKEIIEKANSQAATIITEGEEKAKTKADDIIADALQKQKDKPKR